MRALKTSTKARLYFLGVLVAGSVLPAFAQIPQIAHFVAPSYPPLARRTMLSGRVSLELTVDRQGVVIKSRERGEPAHPLLAQEARACVGEWKFQPADGGRKAFVTLYYGFSGERRERDPRTVVKVDFEDASIRVFVTTDPPPMSQP